MNLPFYKFYLWLESVRSFSFEVLCSHVTTERPAYSCRFAQSSFLWRAYACHKLSKNNRHTQNELSMQMLTSPQESAVMTALVFHIQLIGTVISGFLRFLVKIRFFPRTTTVFAPRTTNPIRIFRQRRLQEV